MKIVILLIILKIKIVKLVFLIFIYKVKHANLAKMKFKIVNLANQKMKKFNVLIVLWDFFYKTMSVKNVQKIVDIAILINVIFV